MAYVPTSLHKRILSHLVFIYDRTESRNSSGVLVKVADRVFVLTAAHVLTGDTIINLGLRHQTTPFTVLSSWIDSSLDVGFLELKPFEVEILRRSEATPYKIGGKQIASIPSSVSTMALCGFPTHFHTVQDGRIGISALYLGCAILHDKEWPTFIREKGNTPESNFAIMFGPKHRGQFYDPDGHPMEKFSPHGMSGCGLWLVDRSTENSNQPIYSLVGIQHSWYPQDQLLVGTYAEKVVDVIARRFDVSLQGI